MAISPDTRKPVFEGGGEDRLVRLGAGAVNYWITFVTDPLTVVFFIFWELTILRTNFFVLAAEYSVGLLSWSLLEYVGHRWLYHKGRTPAHAGHRIHHQSPEMLIAMPWFVVTALFMSLWYFLSYRLQLPFVSGLLAGLLTGFVLYGLFHHVIHHHFHFRNPLYRKLKSQHVIHHQFPDVNFGVTSHFWDHVFGTTFSRKSTKPRAPSTRQSIDY